MEYIKVYENQNPKTLQLMLEDLQAEKILSARINPANKTVIEVGERDQEKAESTVKEILKVWQEMIDSADGLFIKYTITNKRDLIKYFFAVVGLFLALTLSTGGAILISNLDFKFNELLIWAMVILFFASLFYLLGFSSKMRMINIPFPLNPKDEREMIKIRKRLKLFLTIYGLISFFILFIWLVLNGSKLNLEVFWIDLNYSGPWVYLGVFMLILRILANMRKDFNPEVFSPEEIEKNNKEKLKVIEEAKQL